MQIGMRLVLLAAVVFAVLSLSATPSAAQTEDEDRLAAKWVHTLIPYLKWPEKHGNLTLCTVGRGRVTEYLRQLVEKEEAEAAKRGKRLSPVIVESQTTKSQFKACDLLYISISETDVVEDLVDKVRDRPIVTVSDIDNFELRGGMIEFTQESKKKLRINVGRAQKVGVKIDADLLGIAETVSN